MPVLMYTRTHTCLSHAHSHTHTQWADTDNELAVDDGYENITVAYHPAQPTLDFLKFINNDIKPGDTSADCILLPQTPPPPPFNKLLQ